jgi:hypothetical protein
MALRMVASLLAEGVSLDALTDRLTVFNMLEALYAPSLPAVIGKLAVVNIYEVEGEHLDQWERVTIVAPDGQQLAQAVSELSGTADTHRSIGVFQGIKIATDGVYRVIVENGTKSAGPWEIVGQRRVRIDIKPHPLARGPQKGEGERLSGPASLTD